MGKRHYIAGSGNFGCLYDNMVVYDSKGEARKYLADLFELDATDRRCLRIDGALTLKPGSGADYCEVVECDCDDPNQHGGM